MKMRLAGCAMICLLTWGCSDSDDPAKDTGPNSDGVVTKSDGTSSGSFSEANCNKALDMFIAASCPDASTWTKLKSTTCNKLSSSLSTSLCATPLQSASKAFPDMQSATFGCVMGTTDTTSVSAVDVLLGILCAATVNNNDCAGVACKYGSDCPTNYSCNDATKRCFRKDASFCVGLPCKYNMGCPTGLTCNNATGQCNAT